MLRSLRNRNVILLYHRVAEVDNDPWSLCVTPAHFAEHLQVLKRFPRERLDGMKPTSRWFGGLSVAITFDDGYADNYHAAAHLLKRYDTPATFFIATGYIGKTREFWWDELDQVAGNSYFSLYDELQPLSDQVRRARLDELFESAGLPARSRCASLPMSPNDLVALASDDLFEIGAHTVTHPMLSAQPRDVQYREIRESKEWLEVLLDRSVRSFSYPYGGTQHYSADTVAAVEEAGFDRACTTGSRPLSVKDGQYEWPRVPVTDMDGEEFHKFLMACG